MRPAGRPLVSVVISSHEYGAYVGDAIRSALAQTYRPLEVVVVDDGSTDDSRAVIRSFGDRVVPVLKENGGQASALNAGFAASRGQLVMLLDADDMLEPHAAETLAGAWRPGVARVQAPVLLTDESGSPAGGRLPADPMPNGDLRPLVLENGGYPSTGTTGTAFDRDRLARLLPIPEEEWRRAPDAYLWLLAPFVGDVASVDRVVGRVRVHGANKWAMSRLAPERLREHLEGDLHKEALLRARAVDLGTDPPADWLTGSPMHLQSRLAHLRLAPDRHPFPGDRAWRLGLLGIRASVRNRGFSVRKRALFAAWFALVALLPRRAAVRLVDAGLLRTGRPAWLQRFIERGAGARRDRRPAVSP